MKIMLFEIYIHRPSMQFGIDFLTITVGQNSRSLFCVWKDYTRWAIDILFFRIRFYKSDV